MAARGGRGGGGGGRGGFGRGMLAGQEVPWDLTDIEQHMPKGPPKRFPVSSSSCLAHTFSVFALGIRAGIP